MQTAYKSSISGEIMHMENFSTKTRDKQYRENPTIVQYADYCIVHIDN